MLRRKHVAFGAATLGAAALCLTAWAGVSAAVSGGGYSSSQQDCQPSSSDYATPNDEIYPGCHNTAVNVESGGASNGNPSPGNTRYVEFGSDQVPNDPNSVGTNTPLSLGEPGYTGSPHAGCLAANTDGTGGGPAPSGTGPQPVGPASEDSQYGCGNNPNGAGFEINYDYYQWYCPLAAAAGQPCEDSNPGTTTVAFDHGSGIDYQDLVSNGVLVYFGEDDNIDNGEHDGLGPFGSSAAQLNNGAINGPSDGGAMMLSLTPQNAAQTPSQTNPEGLANLSFGSCADGICESGTTQQQTVYQGCGAPDSNGNAPCNAGTPQSANVYDYAPGGSTANDPSVNTESAGCNSGDANTSSTAQCGPTGMNGLRSATPANENTEPGVQIYSDPDPQRSPAAPAPLWPTPAVYVGTCGVYAGSPATTGQVLGSTPTSAGPLQLTNAAGQIAIDPNPSAC